MLGRNIFFNLVGAVFPSLVSILVIPPYLHLIGAERFGIISLIWLVFGYFGLFDFGLSHATANSLAKIEDERSELFAETFWTALAFNAALGVLGGLIFLVVGSQILRYVSGASPVMQGELARSIPWVSALIPLATIGGVFNGSLEATNRFFYRNILQVLGTLLFQPLPLVATLIFSPSVETTVIATAVGRLLSVSASAIVAIRIVSFRHGVRPRIDLGMRLLNYGGWVTVTNLISPILISVDQIIIGAMLGAKTLTFYAIPYNLSTKVLIVPNAVVNVLFPRFSGMRNSEAFRQSEKIIIVLALVMGVIIVPAMLMADEFLRLWIGSDFAARSAGSAKLLLLASWINSVAFVPYCLLQSRGRPDVVAKLHAIECLPFLALLWFTLKTIGVFGAPIAWSVRVVADCGLLLVASGTARRDVANLCPYALIVMLAWVAAALCEPDLVTACCLSIVFLGALVLTTKTLHPTIYRSFAPLLLGVILGNRTLNRSS